jgi:hypothetical protein
MQKNIAARITVLARATSQSGSPSVSAENSDRRDSIEPIAEGGSTAERQLSMHYLGSSELQVQFVIVFPCLTQWAKPFRFRNNNYVRRSLFA